MEIQSRGMCRADGKVYEKLVVSGLGEANDLRVIVGEIGGQATLPCELVVADNRGTERIVYVVAELLFLRRCVLRLAEVDRASQIVSSVDHEIDFGRIKWSSRFNRLAKGRLVDELTRHEGVVVRDETSSVSVSMAIPTPTHLILRGTYRFPTVNGAVPHVFCVNGQLEIVAAQHTSMGSHEVSVADGRGSLTEESFSLRIPWNQGNIYICAQDDSRPGTCVHELLRSGQVDALVERATADLYNNAWGDPYYPEWFSRQKPTSYELDLQRQATFDYMPTFSLIVPLFRTPAELRGCGTRVSEKVVRRLMRERDLSDCFDGAEGTPAFAVRLFAGVCLLGIAALQLAARAALARFSRRGPKMAVAVYVSMAVQNAFILAARQMRAVELDAAIAGAVEMGCVVSALLAVCNYLYYRKRAAMFVH